MKNVDRFSSVSIATRYGLDGLGIKSRWGRDFLHPLRPALGTTQPPGHSQLAPRLKKEQSYTSTPPVLSLRVVG